MANQLLALSRADARSLDVQPLLRVDLKNLSETLREAYLDAAEGKQIDLGLDVQAVHIDGHDWLLRELLCNLLDNGPAACHPPSDCGCWSGFTGCRARPPTAMVWAWLLPTKLRACTAANWLLTVA